MPLSRFNEQIDFVEVPVVSPPRDCPTATVQRVEKDLDRLQEIWEMLQADEAPQASYPIPEDVRLSVVIPAYNERSTLFEVIARVHALPLETEIIVVDDCSTDGTRGWLETVRDAPGLTVLMHEQNAGKGAALRTGFAAATGDIVVVQDADLEYHPKDILDVIQPIIQGRADVVYGSRFLGERQDHSLFHRAVNRMLTQTSNAFTGLRLTDMETCYKAFRRHVLRDLPLRQNRFGFEPEVTAKVARRRYRVTECAIGYRPRGYADGKKIGLRDAISAIWCIVRYGVRD